MSSIMTSLLPVPIRPTTSQLSSTEYSAFGTRISLRIGLGILILRNPGAKYHPVGIQHPGTVQPLPGCPVAAIGLDRGSTRRIRRGGNRFRRISPNFGLCPIVVHADLPLVRCRCRVNPGGRPTAGTDFSSTPGERPEIVFVTSKRAGWSTLYNPAAFI